MNYAQAADFTRRSKRISLPPHPLIYPIFQLTIRSRGLKASAFWLFFERIREHQAIRQFGNSVGRPFSKMSARPECSPPSPPPTSDGWTHSRRPRGLLSARKKISLILSHGENMLCQEKRDRGGIKWAFFDSQKLLWLANWCLGRESNPHTHKE